MSQPPPTGWGQPPPPAKPKAPLLLGILIGAVAPFLGVVPLLALSNVESPRVVADLAGLAPFVWTMAVLATGAGLLFSDRTRRWGVGILLGFFGMLVIGAGLCVAALVVVLSAYNGG